MEKLDSDLIEKSDNYDYMLNKIENESYNYYTFASNELKQNYSFCVQTIDSYLRQSQKCEYYIKKFQSLLRELNDNIKHKNIQFVVKIFPTKESYNLSYSVQFYEKPKIYSKKNN